ncbi:unnamed protein product [Cunninghamella blakesleeana]
MKQSNNSNINDNDDDDWGLNSASSGTDTDTSSEEDNDCSVSSSSAAILQQRQKMKMKKRLKPNPPTISTTTTTTLLDLPHELLCEIFILSSNPNIPIVCKALYYHFYYSSDYLKTKWLLVRHKDNLLQAFEGGLKFPFFSIQMIQDFDHLYSYQQQQQLKIELLNHSNEIMNEPTTTVNNTNHNSITIPYEQKKIPPYLFNHHHHHSMKNPLEFIELLLKRGASPNKPKGYPLIKSAQLGRKDYIQLLIQYGADPTIRNNMALRSSVARNNKELTLYFLEELNVKPDSETLKVAVQKEFWDIVQLLMDHGAVPDMDTVNFM